MLDGLDARRRQWFATMGASVEFSGAARAMTAHRRFVARERCFWWDAWTARDQPAGEPGFDPSYARRCREYLGPLWDVPGWWGSER